MYIGIAILVDSKIHNMARDITFNLKKKYNTGIEAALLPQHISLKQSFPYDDEISEIEEYVKEFCLGLKPFKIFIEKFEINVFRDSNIIAWLKVRESKELRNIHRKLCETIEEKFGIKPLGFDGDRWTFHSTLAYGELNKDCIKKITEEYNNMEINMEFEAKEIAILCCLSDYPKTSEFFTLKILNIGSEVLTI